MKGEEPCDDTERRWSLFSQWLNRLPPPAYRFRYLPDTRSPISLTWEMPQLTTGIVLSCLAILAGCDYAETTSPNKLIVNADKIATQTPGDIFAWPANTKLTSLDECIIALPAAILTADEPIGSVIDGDDDMGINIPDGDDRIYIRLMPDMSVTIRRSCQAMIVGDDTNPRRFRVGGMDAGSK